MGNLRCICDPLLSQADQWVELILHFIIKTTLPTTLPTSALTSTYLPQLCYCHFKILQFHYSPSFPFIPCPLHFSPFQSPLPFSHLLQCPTYCHGCPSTFQFEIFTSVFKFSSQAFVTSSNPARLPFCEYYPPTLPTSSHQRSSACSHPGPKLSRTFAPRLSPHI